MRQSSNPFYETTNSLYGDQDVQQKDLKDLVSSNTIAAHKPSEFSFLYSRTSDVYGKDPMKAKLDGFDYDSASANKASSAKDDLMRVKHTIDVESALKIYKHESIRQNPLYSTSASEIGKKAPTVATYVAERCHRAQVCVYIAISIFPFACNRSMHSRSPNPSTT